MKDRTEIFMDLKVKNLLNQNNEITSTFMLCSFIANNFRPTMS